MRERQQMASRPFASVAVALEVGGDQEELLQVSKETQTWIQTDVNTIKDTHKHTWEIETHHQEQCVDLHIHSRIQTPCGRLTLCHDWCVIVWVCVDTERDADTVNKLVMQQIAFAGNVLILIHNPLSFEFSSQTHVKRSYARNYLSSPTPSVLKDNDGSFPALTGES